MFDLISKSSPHQIKNDLLSGLTVALALVPEAVAFALIAQVHPLVGLYAAFIMGLVTALIGGRPGMISGATGATAVVMVSLVLEHGLEYLLAAVVLAGLIQITFGLLRLGKFIRLVPHPVFLGFVNGLALVIFLAQLEHFKVKDASGATQWLMGSELGIMLGLVALTMAIIHFLPRLTTILPSTLVAILAGTLLTVGLGLETRTVGDMASIAGGWPTFHIPEIQFGLDALLIVLPYAVVLAMVGLIESLLTLNLVDELTGERIKLEGMDADLNTESVLINVSGDKLLLSARFSENGIRKLGILDVPERKLYLLERKNLTQSEESSVHWLTEDTFAIESDRKNGQESMICQYRIR